MADNKNVSNSRRRRSLTIKQKLIGLIVILMTAIVGFLAVYFPSRQIRAIQRDLTGKAHTYGALVTTQVRSAVAFDDRETAREVLDSVASDPDVIAVVLFGQRGSELYKRGEPGSWTASVRQGVAVERVFPVGDRVAVAAPVISLEGPRGAIVIELSTARVAASRRQVMTAAVVVGFSVLCVGIAVAWLIARSLARRLRAIAQVAVAVAEGDLDQQPVEDRSGDEIGALAAGFNVMLRQIKDFIARIQDMARVEQERLEELVRQRTAELDARNDDMRLVLDNVEQGLFTVELDGRIGAERSAAVEAILGPIPASESFFDLIRRVAPERADWFAMSWHSLTDGILPFELCLDQLPAELRAGERHVRLAYKAIPVHDGAAARVLVVVTDVTAVVERERAERDERETFGLLSRLLRDRAGFLAFFTETDALVKQVVLEGNAGGEPTVELKRHVHTLKGSVGLFGLLALSELCHEIENAMEESLAELPSACRAMQERWLAMTTKLVELLAHGTTGIELQSEDHEELIEALDRNLPIATIRRIVESWRHELVGIRLGRLADQARNLAERLGKGPIEVFVEAGRLRLPVDQLGSFWTELVHAVRNAVDHGLETAEERKLAGKPEVGRINLRARKQGDRLVIEVEDHGRGIDWDRLRAKAQAAGLPAETRQDLVDALFADGLSTRDEVSETSGRGVGLGALKAACVASGGTIQVETQLGRGTQFSFTWPMNGHAPARQRRASALQSISSI